MDKFIIITNIVAANALVFAATIFIYSNIIHPKIAIRIEKRYSELMSFEKVISDNFDLLTDAEISLLFSF